MNFTKFDILTLLLFVTFGIGFIFLVFGVLLKDEKERGFFYTLFGIVFLTISILGFSFYT